MWMKGSGIALPENRAAMHLQQDVFAAGDVPLSVVRERVVRDMLTTHTFIQSVNSLTEFFPKWDVIKPLCLTLTGNNFLGGTKRWQYILPSFYFKTEKEWRCLYFTQAHLSFDFHVEMMACAHASYNPNCRYLCRGGVHSAHAVDCWLLSFNILSRMHKITHEASHMVLSFSSIAVKHASPDSKLSQVEHFS